MTLKSCPGQAAQREELSGKGLTNQYLKGKKDTSLILIEIRLWQHTKPLKIMTDVSYFFSAFLCGSRFLLKAWDEDWPAQWEDGERCKMLIHPLYWCTVPFCFVCRMQPLCKLLLLQNYLKRREISRKRRSIFACRACIHGNQLPVKGQLYQ